MALPTLETVSAADGAPLKIWAHGYPYRTVRWHYHPEIEIHLVTTTSGRAFVGDYIGAFAPGDLVMTGPNLPHNWLSEVAPGVAIPERCIVLQFGARFLDACIDTFQVAGLADLARQSSRGIGFGDATSRAVAPLMRAMLTGDPLSHPALFLRIVECLIRDERRRPLASVGYRSQPAVYLEQPVLERVLGEFRAVTVAGSPLAISVSVENARSADLDHIRANLGHDLCQAELAALSGYTTSGFSRAFRRQTGMAFTAYVTAMRINHACARLVHSADAITDICFESGFSNVSNFNRQFRATTAMTPREYRRRVLENDRPVRTDRALGPLGARPPVPNASGHDRPAA